MGQRRDGPIDWQTLRPVSIRSSCTRARFLAPVKLCPIDSESCVFANVCCSVLGGSDSDLRERATSPCGSGLRSLLRFRRRASSAAGDAFDGRCGAAGAQVARTSDRRAGSGLAGGEEGADVVASVWHVRGRSGGSVFAEAGAAVVSTIDARSGSAIDAERPARCMARSHLWLLCVLRFASCADRVQSGESGKAMH